MVYDSKINNKDYFIMENQNSGESLSTTIQIFLIDIFDEIAYFHKEEFKFD